MNNVVRKKIIYSLIFPFISSLTAIKNIKSQSSILIIFTFFLLFGLSFNPVNEKADSYRYAQEFRSFVKKPDKNFKIIIDKYLGETSIGEEKIKDIYVYTMYYLSSKIGGDNIHILFFLFALVFAIFYILSLKFIIYNKNFQYCTAAYILLFLFLYSNNIFNINGVRFWTASWVAVYITFKIIIDQRKKWIWCLLILPLIHIGFSAYIIIFIIGYLLKGRTNLMYKIFVISLFLGQLGFIILDSIKEFLPVLLQNMIWNYTESQTAQNALNGEGEATYSIILTSLPRYYELLLLFIIGFNRKKLSPTPMTGFTLAFFSIVNIFSVIPSFGVRFFVVGYPFIIYLWVNSLPFLKKYKYILEFTPIVYAYVMFRWIRSIITVTPISLYYSNYFDIVLKSLF